MINLYYQVACNSSFWFLSSRSEIQASGYLTGRAGDSKVEINEFEIVLATAPAFDHRHRFDGFGGDWSGTGGKPNLPSEKLVVARRRAGRICPRLVRGGSLCVAPQPQRTDYAFGGSDRILMLITMGRADYLAGRGRAMADEFKYRVATL
jgi:hypothetical protein